MEGGNRLTRLINATARGYFEQDQRRLIRAVGSAQGWDLTPESTRIEYLKAAKPLAVEAFDRLKLDPYKGRPVETDDSTMSSSATELADKVVGHRIVSAEFNKDNDLVIRLDNGTMVEVRDTDDCCAYTILEDFWLDPSSVDHIITGVGTSDNYDVWHIYADIGDIMKLGVDWSEGNGYYGYGFDIKVSKVFKRGDIL